MGKSYVVKYFKKISDTAFEPLAHSLDDLNWLLNRYCLAWCEICQAAVEPDITGISICPFCNEEVTDEIQVSN